MSLPSPVIIGLTGFARSGKDSVGRVLVENHGFRRVAFGDTLKLITEDVNPTIEYVVRTSADQQGVARERVNDLLARYGGWEGTKDAVPETRQFLVDLGNSLRHRISGVEISATFGALVGGDRVVNTNVYHGEEIDAIRAMGGKVIRVRRSGFGPANPDEAKTGLHEVDAELHNEGDLQLLLHSVGAALDGFGIPHEARDFVLA